VTRRVEVELHAETRVVTEAVDIGVTGTDEAAVDMAREQAGIRPERFRRGEVVAP
jgi:hypothetical protein